MSGKIHHRKVTNREQQTLPPYLVGNVYRHRI